MLNRFYAILAELEHVIGKHILRECHGRMNWPTRGIYFFFEAGEFRWDGITPRVVHVGTHAVSEGSSTRLWTRLSQHKGTRAGDGNHRGSIFRLHVGSALLARDHSLKLEPDRWGVGSSANPDVRAGEHHVEQAVSQYICSMPFLWVATADNPRTVSLRREIEAKAIALLSCCSLSASDVDPPSENWLGRWCPNEAVQRSGLWNVRDTNGECDPGFLDLLEECAKRTRPL